MPVLEEKGRPSFENRIKNYKNYKNCRKAEEEKMARTETIFDWAANLLGIAGGIPAIAEKLGKIWGSVPGPIQEQIKQRVPGFLGLSLADERIFNALLGKIDSDKRKFLTDFLNGKCKDFQRNRFINIVAGMEVVAGIPTIIERKWNKDAKQFADKTTTGRDGEDLRLNYLIKFAEYIEAHGIDAAYNDCIGGRMILENPFHQKVVAAWKDSIDWFSSIFSSVGTDSLGDLKLSEKIEKTIYACDADDNILLDPKTGKGILKQSLTYKGFKKTALPGDKKRTWMLVIFAAIVIIMMICGFIFS